MIRQYDVIVVGGGPVGSYIAYQLADKGFEVCVLDEKEEIGKDVLCAGVVSKEAFRRYDLPNEAILSKIDAFTFVSVAGQRLRYTHPGVFAYVISRKVFDRNLSELAQRKGVRVHAKHRVIKIKEASNSYVVMCGSKQYRAYAVVLATGVKYHLHSLIGLGKPPRFLYGSQIELPLLSDSSTIEIHLGQCFAPGSFGWIVPSGNGQSRVGVLVAQKGKVWLSNMLRERLDLPRSYIDHRKLRVKRIAHGVINRSAINRILAVGEAAGQVKTTTGGGISYGLHCAEIALDKLSKALKYGHNNLDEYEMAWRNELVPELETGQRLRSVLNTLDDDTIESLFKFVRKNRILKQLLFTQMDYDFHSDLFLSILKRFQSFPVFSGKTIETNSTNFKN